MEELAYSVLEVIKAIVEVYPIALEDMYQKERLTPPSSE